MFSRKNLLGYVLLIVVGLLMLGLIFLLNQQNVSKNTANKNSVASTSIQSNVSSTDSESEQLTTQSQTIKPDKFDLNTLFFGDVFWGRYIDDWSKASPLGFAYPFSGLNTFDRSKYNAWIADMECPITTTYIDSKTQDKLLKFSCPVGYTPEAAKWFSAFTLANNHMDNMQEVDGFDQTKDNLEKNGIQYFGSYDNARKDDICEIVSFKATAIFDIPTANDDTKDYYIPLAMCGFHDVFKLPTDDQMAVISQYSKYLPTIVMPHQGEEYTYKADQLQQSYYRKMIDLGADAVIGDHVHSVQNTEAYKGKLIIYSLGNFIFDQQTRPQVTQAIGLNLDFNFTNDANLQKWLAFSQTCIQYKDNCLQTAQTENLSKPSFSIKYDVVGSDNSGKLAKKASDQVLQDLIVKTNWLATKSKLQTDFN
jgi:poly-gamma-glutamate synthesis protein (capsule biosynthesis protein)